MKLTLNIRELGSNKLEDREVDYKHNPIWFLVGYSQHNELLAIDQFKDPITEQAFEGRIVTVPFSFDLVPLFAPQGLFDLILLYDKDLFCATHYMSESKWYSNSEAIPSYIEPDSLVQVNSPLRKHLGATTLELTLGVQQPSLEVASSIDESTIQKSVYSPLDLEGKAITMVVFPKKWKNDLLSSHVTIETTDGTYKIENQRLESGECDRLQEMCNQLLHGADQTVRTTTKLSQKYINFYRGKVH